MSTIFLKQGYKNPAVIGLKQRLKAHGFWPRTFPINSGFGPRTTAQVKKFQRHAGISVDGQVGPQTWAALNAPNPAKASGERARAVKWANSRVGVTENPPGSNQGRYITAWQEMSSYPGGGVAWCQCFVNASAYVGSRRRIKPSWFGGYTPSVVEMANNGEHGLKRIKLEDARPGDWVYFDFPGGESTDHVGIFIRRSGDTVYTIEGNTSSGNNGSQSNGGGVFKRQRDRSLISATVRVPFKS